MLVSARMHNFATVPAALQHFGDCSRSGGIGIGAQVADTTMDIDLARWVNSYQAIVAIATSTVITLAYTTLLHF